MPLKPRPGHRMCMECEGEGCYWCGWEGQVPENYGEINTEAWVADEMNEEPTIDDMPGPRMND